MSKLCLGTVQFGMQYGINNYTGQPSEEECFEMLDVAIENGIDTIDTARAYGTSEIVLGNYLEYRKYGNKVNIISKLRPNVLMPNTNDVYSLIRKELEDSLKRLHISKLKGYLLHTPEYVYNDKVIQALYQLKKEGLLQNIGVSIYNMEDGFEAIVKKMDYVQLPYSIFDQRGDKSGFISDAKKAGLTIFTRSVFLQGLCMMPLDNVPTYLEHAKPYLKYLEELAKKQKIHKAELLIRFVKSLKEIDYLVFGVDNISQLKENINIFNNNASMDSLLLKTVQEYFSDMENSIILPSLWSNGKKAE